MSFPSTSSGMNEQKPYPIETIQVDDAQMEAFKIQFLADADLNPYVVCNIQDPNNKDYFQWSGTNWISLGDLSQTNRWCIPYYQVETFDLNSDIGDLGSAAPINFAANKDTIGQLRLNPTINNNDVTGLIAPSLTCNNKEILITNISDTFAIRFHNNNGGSVAENRFLFTANIFIVSKNESLLLRYDTVSQRWRPVSQR